MKSCAEMMLHRAWIDTCQTAFSVLYDASHMVKLAPVEDGHEERCRCFELQRAYTRAFSTARVMHHACTYQYVSMER